MSGTYYSTQNLEPILGATKLNNDAFTFSRVTLTASYADNISGTFRTDGQQQIVFFVEHVTHASATSPRLDVRIEFSPDNGTTWFQETESSVAAGRDTLTLVEHSHTGAAAGTTYRFTFNVPVAHRWYRVSLRQQSDTTNFGTASVVALVSGQ